MGEKYEDKGPKPTVGEYFGFDFVSFFVGNALQAADWYCTRMGFRKIAYKGLETGSRDRVHHVIRQNNITLEFISSLNPGDRVLGEQLIQHGDGAKIVAFTVDDAKAIYHAAVERGGESALEPQELTDDHGKVILAGVKTYGDTIHYFVERKDYKGLFLPGYKTVDKDDPIYHLAEPVALNFIDHVVGNQPTDKMVPIVDWYVKVLQFHRFWSIDDKTMRTEYSALKSIVVADYSERVKMPMNEPAPGRRKSQIQEYVDHYGGAGVQHIALRTDNIIHTIENLKKRGCNFLTVPDTYWTTLQKRLAKSPVKIKEDIEILRKLKILVDYDDNGYLLQIFTTPVEDRPTLFYEVIQRNNHQGFGAGNFKALFKAIEDAQQERGNLDNDKGFTDPNSDPNKIRVY